MEADKTQPIPREALLSRPPAEVPESDVAPPRPAPAPRDEGRRFGWVWVVLVVVLVGAFVAATYLVVDRAERDRPTGAGGDDPTDESTTTEAVTTTTAPPPETVAPAELAVVVLNGTSRIGWAGENVTRLGEAGYEGAAADAVTEVDTTTVYVAEGREADGAAVAAAIGLPDAPVEPKPSESLATDGEDADAQVVVVLGADSVG